MYSDEIINEMYSPVLGDINIDELLDANDALEYLKVSAGLSAVSDAQRDTCLIDINGDEIIDAKDALEVLKKAASLRE